MTANLLTSPSDCCVHTDNSKALPYCSQEEWPNLYLLLKNKAMLKGEELGAAVARAIKLKGVKQKDVARHFGIRPPSIQDWIKRGTISKEKLPELWRYFSDAVGPEHWGIEAYPWGPESSARRPDDKPPFEAPQEQSLTISSLLEALRQEIQGKPEAVQEAIAKLTADYLSHPDSETGRAIAEAIERILGKRG